jgi:catechol 2,3-dioxygenase-like lactoylglutathione lyase family enzyme
MIHPLDHMTIAVSNLKEAKAFFELLDFHHKKLVYFAGPDGIILE